MGAWKWMKRRPAKAAKWITNNPGKSALAVGAGVLAIAASPVVVGSASVFAAVPGIIAVGVHAKGGGTLS